MIGGSIWDDKEKYVVSGEKVLILGKGRMRGR